MLPPRPRGNLRSSATSTSPGSPRASAAAGAAGGRLHLRGEHRGNPERRPAHARRARRRDAGDLRRALTGEPWPSAPPSQLNILLALDKPVGCTSHDLVARTRRALGERRVGHAGTLDPLASGVMVLGVGQATRLLGRITRDTKAYLADIAFGAGPARTTPRGERTRRGAARAVGPAGRRASALASLVGPQMPPGLLRHLRGRGALLPAPRAGTPSSSPPVPSRLAADLIAVTTVDDAPVDRRVHREQGTYIRALARGTGRSTRRRGPSVRPAPDRLESPWGSRAASTRKRSRRTPPARRRSTPGRGARRPALPVPDNTSRTSCAGAGSRRRCCDATRPVGEATRWPS